MHGRGVHEAADGARYEGGLKDDKMHGRGVLVDANGDRWEGDWREGERLEMGEG